MLRRLFNPWLLFGLAAALLMALPQLALASSAPRQLPLPDGMQQRKSEITDTVANRVCLECHGKPGLTLTLGDGETLDLFVSPEMYAASIHGEKGYGCVQCHPTVGNYPHPAFTAADKRDASLQLYQACQRCHTSQYERAQDSVHAVALAGGNRNAAVCTDCHTAHDVKQLTDPASGELSAEARAWIPQTCAHCHNEIYQKYLTSVHGAALLGEANPDVPTCIDCHGVHNIQSPTTNTFRLNSPQLCANCHTNPALMDKYGISTQVLNTYVADFHGTTVTLFEKQDPQATTNKPVCYDCHGVHDIKRPDDPEKGLQVRENLLARCQNCHPDATANFPEAWLSHYIPSPEKFPVVYSVNLFYSLFIPGLLGGMAILVALDLSYRIRSRLWKPKLPPETAVSQPPEQGEPEPGSPSQPVQLAVSDPGAAAEQTGYPSEASETQAAQPKVQPQSPEPETAEPPTAASEQNTEAPEAESPDQELPYG